MPATLIFKHAHRHGRVRNNNNSSDIGKTPLKRAAKHVPYTLTHTLEQTIHSISATLPPGKQARTHTRTCWNNRQLFIRFQRRPFQASTHPGARVNAATLHKHIRVPFSCGNQLTLLCQPQPRAHDYTRRNPVNNSPHVVDGV